MENQCWKRGAPWVRDQLPNLRSFPVWVYLYLLLLSTNRSYVWRQWSRWRGYNRRLKLKLADRFAGQQHNFCIVTLTSCWYLEWIHIDVSDVCLCQLWTEMAEQLTSGVADYSTALGNVCSLHCHLAIIIIITVNLYSVFSYHIISYHITYIY